MYSTMLDWMTKLKAESTCENLAKTISAYIAQQQVLVDFSLTVKAATLIFISGRGSAFSSAKEGKSGFIYKLVKS